MTYNNIKPSHILLGKNGQNLVAHESQNIFKGVKIRLIDLMLTEPYIMNGVHISEENVGIFRGTIAYASIN